MTKIKNRIIVALINAGCSNITAMTIEAAHAYKVIKFRRAILKAFEEIVEKEKELIRECSLEVGERGVLNGSPDDIKKFNELREELYTDESEIDSKTIPFESWHELQKENKCLVSAPVEDALEGILWETPTE